MKPIPNCSSVHGGSSVFPPLFDKIFQSGSKSPLPYATPNYFHSPPPSSSTARWEMKGIKSIDAPTTYTYNEWTLPVFSHYNRGFLALVFVVVVATLQRLTEIFEQKNCCAFYCTHRRRLPWFVCSATLAEKPILLMMIIKKAPGDRPLPLLAERPIGLPPAAFQLFISIIYYCSWPKRKRGNRRRRLFGAWSILPTHSQSFIPLARSLPLHLCNFNWLWI